MITVGDKTFTVFIERQAIEAQIARLAQQICKEYEDKEPLFIGIMNGSFMFASDLMKQMPILCEVSFVKVASYHNMASTGKVQELVGLQEDIKGRHVILLEDIVDTGITMSKLLDQLQTKEPASVEIATLLFKPKALQKPISPRYIGFEIENKFVIGFGLDYNGLGRNLTDIYVLKEETH